MAIAIERDDAIATVQDQGATDKEPTVGEEAVADIVDRSARMDDDDNAVLSDDWTPTYDLNSATALVWERKAALTATAKFDVSIDGQTLTRSQIYDHCMAQAKTFRARVASAVRREQPENVPYWYVKPPAS